jgi:hypothetical protein
LEAKEKQKSPFHYSKLVRQETLVKKRKQKQLEWLRRMYSLEKNHIKIEDELSAPACQKTKVGWVDLQGEKAWNNDDKFVRNNLKQKNDPETLSDLLKEIDAIQNDPDLVCWTKELDFETYHENWMKLATASQYQKEEPGFYATEDLAIPEKVEMLYNNELKINLDKINQSRFENALVIDAAISEQNLFLSNDEKSELNPGELSEGITMETNTASGSNRNENLNVNVDN